MLHSTDTVQNVPAQSLKGPSRLQQKTDRLAKSPHPAASAEAARLSDAAMHWMLELPTCALASPPEN